MLEYFISHASEDKNEIAGPIADCLIGRGLKVWYDEFSLTLGDSIRRSIDYGLARCDFAVVVLSPSFFRKQWPQSELDGIYSRELDENRKLLLPVLHKISIREVREFSPMLAGKLGVSTEKGVELVCDQIVIASRQHMEVKTMHERLKSLYRLYYAEVYSAGADDGAGYDTLPASQSDLSIYKQQIAELEEKLMPFFADLNGSFIKR